MRQHFLRQIVRSRSNLWVRVVGAVLLSALFIQGMIWTQVWQRYPPALCMMLPVILCALLGGWWSGVAAVACSLLMVDRSVLVELAKIWDVQNHVTYPAYILGFSLIGLMISALAETIHRVSRRARAHRRAYLEILSNIGDAVVVTDAVGHIEYLNPAACQLVGCQASAAIGRSFESVFVIRDALGAVQPPFASAQLAGPARPDNRQYLKRADGQRICLESTIVQVRDGRGNIRNLVMTLRDCTDRQRIDEETSARIAAQQRLERLVATLDAMVFEVHAIPGPPGQLGKSELRYLSDAYQALLGLSLEEIQAHPQLWLGLCHPDDAERVKQQIAHAEHNCGPLRMEFRVLLPQRGVRWLLSRSISEQQTDGSVLWRGIIMDITEQKMVEQRLAESHAQLQAALTTGHLGLVHIALDTGVVTLDQAARALWDLADAPPQLTVNDLLSRVHPEATSDVIRQYQQMCVGEQAHYGEYRLLTRAGEERLLVCHGRVYRDMSGTLIKEGIVSDKSREKRLEGLRLHSQKLEALGVMAGGIAHDFNNLLLVIAGNTRLLKAELHGDGRVRASLGEIEKACQRATEVVRRILTFSRVDQQHAPTVPTDVREVFAEAVQLARAALPPRITVQAELESQLPLVQADASQLMQAVLNLMTNAADAMPDGGVVALSTREQHLSDAQALFLQVRPGAYVCVCVTDQGSGIAPTHLPRIFDPFFTTKPAGRGTGLGLAIVHGVMKAHHGAVTVTNRPEGGAEFCLYFPALAEPVFKPHAAAAPRLTALRPAGVEGSSSVSAPLAATAGACILYVDDEDALVFLIQRTLKRAGHRVVGCTTPEEALNRYRESPNGFDLVVSDMSMPGMTGLTLAQQILAVNPAQPFIITTGFVHAEESAQALQIGVRQVILKPNTVDELSAAIMQVLSERQQRPAAATSAVISPA